MCPKACIRSGGLVRNILKMSLRSPLCTDSLAQRVRWWSAIYSGRLCRSVDGDGQSKALQFFCVCLVRHGLSTNTLIPSALMESYRRVWVGA